jgi:hypothetical protein
LHHADRGIPASANIKALETVGYAEHICNFYVISDSWFYGKVSVVRTPLNFGVNYEHITILNEVRILNKSPVAGITNLVD